MFDCSITYVWFVQAGCCVAEDSTRAGHHAGITARCGAPPEKNSTNGAASFNAPATLGASVVVVSLVFTFGVQAVRVVKAALLVLLCDDSVRVDACMIGVRDPLHGCPRMQCDVCVRCTHVLRATVCV